jgi:hypothetical protein
MGSGWDAVTNTAVNPDLCTVICSNCRIKVTRYNYLAPSYEDITAVSFDTTGVNFDITVVFLLNLV